MPKQLGNDGDDNNVLEGFICPMCKEDFKAPERLTAHFDSAHLEDQDLLKSFKEIFLTAKKKIKYFDENVLSGADGGSGATGGSGSGNATFNISPKKINIPPPVYSQDIGIDCDHTEYFKAIRYVVFVAILIFFR